VLNFASEPMSIIIQRLCIGKIETLPQWLRIREGCSGCGRGQVVQHVKYHIKYKQLWIGKQSQKHRYVKGKSLTDA